MEGVPFAKKADSTPLYVENPLSLSLNICQNVSQKALDNFTETARNAAVRIDSFCGGHPDSGKSFLDVLLAKESHPVTKGGSSSVLITDLFSEEKESETEAAPKKEENVL